MSRATETASWWANPRGVNAESGTGWATPNVDLFGVVACVLVEFRGCAPGCYERRSLRKRIGRDVDKAVGEDTPDRAVACTVTPARLHPHAVSQTERCKLPVYEVTLFIANRGERVNLLSVNRGLDMKGQMIDFVWNPD